MVGFCSAAIEFEYGKIATGFEVLDGGAFDVVATVIELFCVMTELVEDLEELVVDLRMEIDEPGAPVVIAGIGEVKMFSCGKDAMDTIGMAVAHFFEPQFGSGVLENEFPKGRRAVAGDFEQFFLDEPTDGACGGVGVTVIEYADFDGKFDEVLDDIADGDTLVVFGQLFFEVNFAKEDAFHADIRLNDEGVMKAGSLNAFEG